MKTKVSNKLILTGRSSLFGILFPFILVSIIGIVLVKENELNTIYYLIFCVIGLFVEISILSNIFCKYYLFKDKVVKKFPLAPWVKDWECMIEEINYIEYTGNLGRYTPPAIIHIHDNKGDSRSFHFIDYDRKKLKTFVRYMSSKGVNVRNKFLNHKIEDLP